MSANSNRSRGWKRLASLIATAIWALLACAPPALADNDHDRGGRGNGRWSREAGEWRGIPPGQRGRPSERDGRWNAPPPQAYPVPRYTPYGVGPEQVPLRRAPPSAGIRRGGLIPPEYRGAVVPDYSRHRLRPPPPGFAWIRMGDRYMLVSRATGQIFDVIGE